jgi:hypothetical protein
MLFCRFNKKAPSLSPIYGELQKLYANIGQTPKHFFAIFANRYKNSAAPSSVA